MSNNIKWCQIISNSSDVSWHFMTLQWHIIFFHDISDHVSCYEQYLGKWFLMNSDDFLITSNDYESLFIVLTSWIPASKNFCSDISSYERCGTQLVWVFLIVVSKCFLLFWCKLNRFSSNMCFSQIFDIFMYSWNVYFQWCFTGEFASAFITRISSFILIHVIDICSWQCWFSKSNLLMGKCGKKS